MTALLDTLARLRMLQQQTQRLATFERGHRTGVRPLDAHGLTSLRCAQLALFLDEADCRDLLVFRGGMPANDGGGRGPAAA